MRQFIVFALLLFAIPCMSQRLVNGTSGAITINVNESNDFQVLITGNITSVSLATTSGTPNGKAVTVYFSENSVGGFTVTFGGNITTTCAVTTTANATTICRWQYNSSSNTWGDSGGGGGNSSGTVSPLSFGAKWDAKFIYDATITNASGAVACAQSDCWFTAGDVGKQGFGASSTNVGGATSVGLVLPQSAVQSVTDANHLTMTTPATATCTPSGVVLCTFADGTDDTTAINSAVSTAWGSLTSGQCLAVVFPGGNAFFSGPIGNLTITQLSSACGGSAGNAAQSGADTNQSGPSLYGCGPQCSVLIPLPNYSFAGCTFGSGNGCNFTTGALQIHDIGMNGLGVTLSATTHTNEFVQLRGSAGGGACTGSTGFNMSFSNFGLNSTNLVGISLGGNACGDPYYWNIISEIFGSTNCKFIGQGTGINTNVTAIACFGASSQAVNIFCSGSVGVVNTQFNFYGEMTAGGPAIHQSGCIWNSFGDATIWSGPNQSNGATIYFNDSPVASTAFITNSQLQFGNSASGTSQVFNVTASAPLSLHLKNSQIFISVAANIRMFSTNSNLSFFDDGGNTWNSGGALPAVASSIAGPFIATTTGNGVKGICTGVGTAASTLALRITGTSTTGTGIPTTCTSTTLDAGVPMQGSRTLFGLAVTASAAGTNASSGVVTVMKNGVATAVTCTIGTGTSCNDFIHSASAVDGDLITIQFTTQAADTLAGVKAVADWF